MSFDKSDWTVETASKFNAQSSIDVRSPGTRGKFHRHDMSWRTTYERVLSAYAWRLKQPDIGKEAQRQLESAYKHHVDLLKACISDESQIEDDAEDQIEEQVRVMLECMDADRQPMDFTGDSEDDSPMPDGTGSPFSCRAVHGTPGQGSGSTPAPQTPREQRYSARARRRMGRTGSPMPSIDETGESGEGEDAELKRTLKWAAERYGLSDDGWSPTLHSPVDGAETVASTPAKQSAIRQELEQPLSPLGEACDIVSALMQVVTASQWAQNPALKTRALTFVYTARGRIGGMCSGSTAHAPPPIPEDLRYLEAALKHLVVQNPFKAGGHVIPAHIDLSKSKFGMVISDCDDAFRSKEVLEVLSSSDQEDIWMQGCMMHVFLRHDKEKRLLKTLDPDAVRAHLRTALQCCIQPSSAAVMEGLLAAAWEGEPEYSKSMLGYVANCGGLQPRCVPNAVYKSGMPADQQSLESRNHTRRAMAGDTQHHGVVQLHKIASTVESTAVLQKFSWFGRTLHPDVYCRKFFQDVYQSLKLNFPALKSSPGIVLSVAECAITVKDFKLEVCAHHDATECVVMALGGRIGRRIADHIDVRVCKVHVMPSPETLTEMFDKRDGAVTDAAHARKILTTKSEHKGAEGMSWVARFREVVESPEEAQKRHMMDLNCFASWSTAFAVLVPVSDACA